MTPVDVVALAPDDPEAKKLTGSPPEAPNIPNRQKLLEASLSPITTADMVAVTAVGLAQHATVNGAALTGVEAVVRRTLEATVRAI